MNERLVYPAVPRWSISTAGHNLAATVFEATLISKGFAVLMRRELAEKRERLRHESFAAPVILWREDEYSRSLLLRWRQPDGVVLIDQHADSTVKVSVASNDPGTAQQILSEIDKVLAREEPSGDTVVQMLFWHAAETAEITQRQIEVAQWNDIAANYAAQTRQQLAELMEGFRPAKNKGRLLLWHGEPGTGKTFAIRALAWAWRDWCRFEYVIDPDRLFASPSYMIEVAVEGPAGHFLFDDKWNSATWRLLVIEDSGELMALDGRNQLDQALSRLLNLTDGILGQGTNLLILVTTNEELGSLHPAVRRPGRCLSEIEFRRFNRDEATTWLQKAGSDAKIGQALTLSELYALRDGQKPFKPKTIGFRPGEVLIDGNGASA
jgi:hypothetical protein